MLFNYLRDLKSPLLRRLFALLILFLLPPIALVALIVGLVAVLADLVGDFGKFAIEIYHQALKDPFTSLVFTIKTGEKPL